MNSTKHELLSFTQNLRRKLSFWRVISFSIFLISILIISALSFDLDQDKNKPHIALVRIEGIIYVDHDFLKMLDKIKEDQMVEAVLFSINSPGGTVAGGEVLYDTIAAISEVKPTAVAIDELGASAAYMAALGSNQIFAQRTSITGSIGVIMEHMDTSELMKIIGIKMNQFKTGDLKGEPNMYNPPSDKATQSVNKLLNSSFQFFVDLVAKERNLSQFQARSLSDGRVFTGMQAIEEGLIDQVGSRDSAKKWLNEKLGTQENLEIVKWQLVQEDQSLNLLDILLNGLNTHKVIDKFLLNRLDGLLSIWHPSSSNH